MSYIPDNSAVRKVHREQAVAFGGPRSLLMMAAHPVAFEGFFASTTAMAEPYDRLRRAGEALDELTWGDERRADVITGYARKAHAKATGVLPEDAGRFPAGTVYRADDPELLMWILACIVDSSLLAYERFVGPLPGADKDGYWRDFRIIGAKFGLAESDMPDSYDDFAGYWQDMLDGPDLWVTPRARETGRRIVLNPPVSLKVRPLLEVANFVTAGMLPRRFRRAYGLSWDPLRGLWLRGSEEYVRRVLVPVLPSSLRLVSSARSV